MSQGNWYALYVRSRHEKSVYEQLEGRGQAAFLPLYAARNRWRDRWKTVSLPLFPGYVFCQLDLNNRLPVLSMSGVIDVVRVGSDPAPVESSEIHAIQRVVQSGLLAEPYAGLIEGQRVMMTGGPLAGITGTLTEIRKNLRLVLTAQLLHRSVLVEIERDWVVPCDRGVPAYVAAALGAAPQVA